MKETLAKKNIYPGFGNSIHHVRIITKQRRLLLNFRVINSLAVSKLTSAKVLLSKLWTVCKIRRNKRDEFMSTKQ